MELVFSNQSTVSVTSSKFENYKSISNERIKNFISKHSYKLAEAKIELISNYISDYSKLYDIDPTLVLALISRESSSNT